MTITNDIIDCQNITDPSMCDDQDDQPNYKSVTSVLLPLILGVIITIGVFGNIIVIIAVAVNKRMRNTTNMLILNLAVADLVFVVLCLPFKASNFALSYWNYGEDWCKSVQYLNIATSCVHAYTLVLISADRFLATTHSLRVSTKRNVILAILVKWILFLVVCIPLIFVYGEKEFKQNGTQYKLCIFLEEHVKYVTIQISLFAIFFVLPLLVTFAFYFCILLKRSVSLETDDQQDVTRISICITTIFFICCLPVQIINILDIVDVYEYDQVNTFIAHFVHVISFLYCCVNPILYARMSEDFKNAFHRLVCYGCSAVPMQSRCTESALNASNDTSRLNSGNDATSGF